MKSLPFFFFLFWANLASSTILISTDSLPPVCDSLQNELPQKIDLTPFCPEVRNQGRLPSCVGWALGYGALTIERAIRHDCTDKKIITHNASSALFIFNQTRRDSLGSRLRDAMFFLETNGDCLARHFDFDVNDGERQPSAELSEAALTFSVAGATALFEKEDSAALKVSRVRQALAQNKPVVAGVAIRRNFLKLKNAVYWWPQLGDTMPAGGHALVVVGYDERRQAFQLMNSWGRQWGEQGFIWMKYAVFGQFCRQAYVLRLR
ncbi:MAG: C1 family peptidase [Bacteroidota bacterium]